MDDDRVVAEKTGASVQRPRRLRSTPGLRSLVRETRVTPADIVCPLFVVHGSEKQDSIESMPGVYRWSVDHLSVHVGELKELGIGAALLFGIPADKDPSGTGAYDDDGVVQQAVREIKRAHPDFVVITDVCLCEYTDHGHCGVVVDPKDQAAAGQGYPPGYVLNQETLALLEKVAVSHANAGADVVAPSGMIDGMVHTIRGALDRAGFEHVAILSYAAKYASAFYGPFRDAAEGAPQWGDRRSHQMDAANAREAMKEIGLDVEEGADMVMVKPGLAYLDVVRRAKDQFPDIPLVVYNVSGEYSMVRAAAANGWIDERATVIEVLTSMKRAGADVIITYHARDAARWLNDDR